MIAKFWPSYWITSSRRSIKPVAALLVCYFFYSSNTSAQLSARQSILFTNNCLQCHANPESTAPVYGVANDWIEVARQNEDTTLANVVNGIRGMPPLGYCSACSEQDFRALIKFMLNIPGLKN